MGLKSKKVNDSEAQNICSSFVEVGFSKFDIFQLNRNGSYVTCILEGILICLDNGKRVNVCCERLSLV